MYWLLLVLAAVVAFILWKRSTKTDSDEGNPRTEESQRQQVTLKVTVAAETATHPTPEPPLEASLEKDAWEDWSDELYTEATRELSASLTITYRASHKGQVYNLNPI